MSRRNFLSSYSIFSSALRRSTDLNEIKIIVYLSIWILKILLLGWFFDEIFHRGNHSKWLRQRILERKSGLGYEEPKMDFKKLLVSIYKKSIIPRSQTLEINNFLIRTSKSLPETSSNTESIDLQNVSLFLSENLELFETKPISSTKNPRTRFFLIFQKIPMDIFLFKYIFAAISLFRFIGAFWFSSLFLNSYGILVNDRTDKYFSLIGIPRSFQITYLGILGFSRFLLFYFPFCVEFFLYNERLKYFPLFLIQIIAEYFWLFGVSLFFIGFVKNRADKTIGYGTIAMMVPSFPFSMTRKKYPFYINFLRGTPLNLEPEFMNYRASKEGLYNTIQFNAFFDPTPRNVFYVLAFTFVQGVIFLSIGVLMLDCDNFSDLVKKIKKKLFKLFKNVKLKPAKEQKRGSQGSFNNLERSVEYPRSGLVLKNLTKVYSGFSSHFVALDAVSLSIDASEKIAILGANGAGKTTFFDCLVGLTKKTSGSIWLNGKKIRSYYDLIGKVGYCPQFSYFISVLTVKENIEIFARDSVYCKVKRKKALADLGLADHLNKKPSELSGGQKRKLSFYLAVATGRPLIILDEPTTGVDAFSKKAIKNVLNDFCSESIVIISSHLVEDLEGLSDRILYLKNGRKVQFGTQEELLKHFGSEGYFLNLKTFTQEKIDRNLTTLIKKRLAVDIALYSSKNNSFVFKLPNLTTLQKVALYDILDENLQELNIRSYNLSPVAVDELLKLPDPSNNHSSHERKIHNNKDILSDGQLDSSKINTLPRNSVVMSFIISRSYFIFISLFSSYFCLLCLLAILVSSIMFSQNCFSEADLKIKPIDFSDEKTVEKYLSKARVDCINCKQDQIDLLKSLGIQEENIKTIIPVEEKGRGNAIGLGDQVRGCGNNIILARTSGIQEDWYSKNSTKNFQGLCWLVFINMLQENYIVENHMRENDNLRCFAYQAPDQSRVENVFLFPSHEALISKYILNLKLCQSQNKIKEKISFKPAFSNHLPEKKPFLLNATVSVLYISIVLFFVFAYQTIINQQELEIFKTYGNSSVSIFFFDISFLSLIITLFFTVPFIATSFFYSNNQLNLFLVQGLGCFFLGILCTNIFTFLVLYTCGVFTGSTVVINLVFFRIGVRFILKAYTILKEFGITKNDAFSFFNWIFFAKFLTNPLFLLLNVLEIFSAFGHSRKIMHESFFTLIMETFEDINQEILNVSHFDEMVADFHALTLTYVSWQVILTLIVLGLSLNLFTHIPSFLFKRFRKSGLKKAIVLDGMCIKKNTERINKAFDGTLPENRNCAIIMKDVNKVYGGFRRKFVALKKVGFVLKNKQILGILGANGGGKTTTFGIILGKIIADSGSVKVESKAVRYLKEGHLAYCSQESPFSESMSTSRLLFLYALAAGFRYSDAGMVVEYYLEKFMLVKYKNKAFGALSGGNKRKMVIAASMMHKSRVLILDEPTTGIDMVACEEIWDSINEERSNNGRSIVFSSHSMKETEKLSDEILVLVKGNVVDVGTSDELKSTYGKNFCIKLKVCTDSELGEEMEKEVMIGLNALLMEKEGAKEYIIKVPKDKKIQEVIREAQVTLSNLLDKYEFDVEEEGLEEILAELISMEKI